MSYQIVYPYPAVMTINADNFKSAIKQYAKMNYNYSINSLIITDQTRYMRANLKYYNNGKANKVAISMAPTIWPTDKKGRITDGQIKTDLWPLVPQVTYDTKEYPATTYIEGGFVPSIVPISPYGPYGPMPVVLRY